MSPLTPVGPVSVPDRSPMAPSISGEMCRCSRAWGATEKTIATTATATRDRKPASTGMAR